MRLMEWQLITVITYTCAVALAANSIPFGNVTIHRAGVNGTYNIFVAKYNPDGNAITAYCPVENNNNESSAR